MADLPANVSYGTVNGKFVKAVTDTADALFLPDAVAAAGTVTFDPAPSRLVDATGGPAVTIFPRATSSRSTPRASSSTRAAPPASP